MRNHYENNKAYYQQRRHNRLRNLVDQYKQLSTEEQKRLDAIYAMANELNERDDVFSCHVDHIKPLAKGGKHRLDNLKFSPPKRTGEKEKRSSQANAWRFQS